LTGRSAAQPYKELIPSLLVMVGCMHYVWQDQVATFVQREVLSRFISLFVQPTEGISPDGTQELDVWIQGMVMEIQATVERKLCRFLGEQETL